MRSEILSLLKEDARLTSEQIAERLGCTADEVRREIEQLERERIILGYQALIAPEHRPEAAVTGIIEVRVSPERDIGFDAVAERIARFPEVRTCLLVSGTYDLLVIVDGPTLKDVANFVAAKLSPLDQVRGTATHFVLRCYKDYGVTFFDESAAAERLPVSP